VHVERGRPFWNEYWFGDELYARYAPTGEH
jgi:hypothetical protein